MMGCGKIHYSEIKTILKRKTEQKQVLPLPPMVYISSKLNIDMNMLLDVDSSDLQYVIKHILLPCKFECRELVKETESTQYNGYSFKINELNAKFRVAKITPTKAGFFVTIWKRNSNGITQPFDIIDNIDLIIISVRKEENFGQFIFPASALLKHDIMSKNNKGGKRGIRIYPPWEVNLNKQARKTQIWQSAFFLNILNDQPIDLAKLHILIKNFSRT